MYFLPRPWSNLVRRKTSFTVHDSSPWGDHGKLDCAQRNASNFGTSSSRFQRICSSLGLSGRRNSLGRGCWRVSQSFGPSTRLHSSWTAAEVCFVRGAGIISADHSERIFRQQDSVAYTKAQPHSGCCRIALLCYSRPKSSSSCTDAVWWNGQCLAFRQKK